MCIKFRLFDQHGRNRTGWIDYPLTLNEFIVDMDRSAANGLVQTCEDDGFKDHFVKQGWHVRVREPATDADRYFRVDDDGKHYMHRYNF